MSTQKQYFRQRLAFWFRQLKSRSYISFKLGRAVKLQTRIRLSKFLKTYWLGFLIGAVILFGIIFNLTEYFLEKRALAFRDREDNGLIEQNVNLSPASLNTASANLVHGYVPGVYQTQNPDPLSGQEDLETLEIAISQQIFLISPLSPVTFLRQAPRDKIIEYQVELGDSVSTIAASFGLTTNTVLWANGLNEFSVIKPGQKLVILPVSGVRHTIKSGETITSLAKKYQADEQKIITFNSLPADGQVQEGQELIVSDGVLPLNLQPQAQARTLARYTPQVNTTFPNGKQSHTYPWGYCTWYVAQHRYIPWAGHAKSWLDNARKWGFSTGKTPADGAIMCTQETPQYGHVAYVESVSADGKWVTISEMNAPYFGRKTVRTLSVNYPYIKGYIY